MLSTKEHRKQIDVLSETLLGTISGCSLDTPVDINIVINHLEGSIEPYISEKGERAESYTRKVDNDFAIAIKKPMVIDEWRFVVSRHIGHLFLHMGFCLNEKVWRESDIYLNSVFHRIGYMEEKYEAESFARSFLMPKDLFRSVASSNREPTTGHYIVRNIASYFNVPREQVRKRGEELSLFEKTCLFGA